MVPVSTVSGSDPGSGVSVWEMWLTARETHLRGPVKLLEGCDDYQ
jgi:hypothetical protein